MAEYSAVACAGKFGYIRRDLAEEVIRRRRNTDPKNVYKCKTCKKWHIGSALTHDAKRYKQAKRAYG